MKYHIALWLLLLLWGSNLSSLRAQIKVACVGNSVTFGAGLQDRAHTSYPARLQQMLGDGYSVENFGHSGATLLNKGHRPYVNLKEFRNALNFNPDLVVVHLGLNDTDPRNWPNYRDEFVRDYTALIDSFRTVNPKAKFWICRMSPIFHWHPRFQSGTRDWYWQIQQSIEDVALSNQVKLIDLQEVLYDKPYLMPDALHPNEEGAELLAKRVYSSLTGDWGGLKLSPLFSDKMVLQRNVAIPLAGSANSGEQITVRIGKQTRRTTVADNGVWRIELDPMEAGGPYTLTVESSTQKLSFRDVLVGEVWLCSGQSNMKFSVKQSAERDELQAHAATNPSIRIFNQTPRWETTAKAWDSTVMEEVNQLNYFRPSAWQKANREYVDNCSAVAYAFAKELYDSLQIPIGIIHNSVGGSPIESWIDRTTLEFTFPRILYNWQSNDHIMPWVRERALLNIKHRGSTHQRHPYEPSYLFESAIKPLKSYPIQGVIWYQGESNAHNVELHEQLFPLLVDSWRRTWSRELPFFYVQLSSINRPSWPHFRDSQRRLLSSRPHLGMAVSSDRGDSIDVHPTRKLEVGRRLARLALSNTYQREVVPSGPLYREVCYASGKAILSFDFAEGLTTSDEGDLIGFEIADASGLYYPASAIIVGDEVILSHPSVKEPKFVRYGWAPFTRANLVNGANLPASTFKASHNN